MFKACLECNLLFLKPKNDSYKYFTLIRKYCSIKCYGIAKKGHQPTEETRRKISKAQKGHRPYLLATGKDHPAWKGGLQQKNCLTCNKEFKVKLYRKDTAKYCCHKCSTNDNLGLTPLHERVRKSVRYKRWRKAVFERDNYTCQICFARGGSLHADHIKPFAFFVALRLELGNGRTLCVNCHKKTDTFGTRLMWQRRKEGLFNNL